MPDLNIHTAVTCRTNQEWGPVKVLSSDGSKIYQVTYGRLAHWADTQYGWSCTCPGFKFRKTCNHIKAVEKSGQRCGWNADLEPGRQPVTTPKGELACPECGGPVSAYRVGV